MIDYNPKVWWKLIFMFHKSDSFIFLLPAILGVGAYTLLVVWIEVDYLHLKINSTTAVHSLLGLAISLFLAFRTNTAYDRWWEGRKLWGSIVNNSRNLSFKLNHFLESGSEKEKYANYIISYIYSLKGHLRGNIKWNELDQISEVARNAEHVPNAIMNELMQDVMGLKKEGKLTGEDLLFINEELKSFTDNLGACERILKTPIPYSYSLFIKKVIFIYIITMPFGFAIEFHYWAAPIVMLIFYVFAGIEVLAEEIENPFGSDANDLPLDRIADNIKKNVKEILVKA